MGGDTQGEAFISQLGRVMPLQVNVKTEQHTKVVYQTIEEARAALIANRIDPDVLERAMMPPFPTPKPLPKPGRCSDPRSALARTGIRDHLHATMA